MPFGWLGQTSGATWIPSLKAQSNYVHNWCSNRSNHRSLDQLVCPHTRNKQTHHHIPTTTWISSLVVHSSSINSKHPHQIIHVHCGGFLNFSRLCTWLRNSNYAKVSENCTLPPSHVCQVQIKVSEKQMISNILFLLLLLLLLLLLFSQVVHVVYKSK